ncbi:MAG: hypothetical protein ACTSPQ_07325 [Candidatus Helarchaeota archaeon]
MVYLFFKNVGKSVFFAKNFVEKSDCNLELAKNICPILSWDWV